MKILLREALTFTWVDEHVDYPVSSKTEVAIQEAYPAIAIKNGGAIILGTGDTVSVYPHEVVKAKISLATGKLWIERGRETIYINFPKGSRHAYDIGNVLLQNGIPVVGIERKEVLAKKAKAGAFVWDINDPKDKVPEEYIEEFSFSNRAKDKISFLNGDFMWVDSSVYGSLRLRTDEIDRVHIFPSGLFHSGAVQIGVKDGKDVMVKYGSKHKKSVQILVAILKQNGIFVQ